MPLQLFQSWGHKKNSLETVLAAQLFLEKNQSTESIDGKNIHEEKG